MADKIDHETYLYLKQIRCLDKQLERIQLRCDELEQQNKLLSSQCDRLEEDKIDVAAYLAHALAAVQHKLQLLQEQLDHPQLDEGEDKDDLEMVRSRQIQGLQDRINSLKSHNRVQALHFQQQKDQLMCHVDALQQQLVQQKQHYEDIINRLKTEMEF